MTIHACPIPDTLPVATRGRYLPDQPEPTTLELLDRLARRLLEPLPGPFNPRAELARNGAARQVQRAYTQARAIAQVQALGFPATDAFPATGPGILTPRTR